MNNSDEIVNVSNQSGRKSFTRRVYLTFLKSEFFGGGTKPPLNVLIENTWVFAKCKHMSRHRFLITERLLLASEMVQAFEQASMREINALAVSCMTHC